jgi:hypothetical protein
MEGRDLEEGEIVHHIDGEKQHNCIPSQITCGDDVCFGNLEVLGGEAAAEHCRRHRLWEYAISARRAKRKRQSYGKSKAA